MDIGTTFDNFWYGKPDATFLSAGGRNLAWAGLGTGIYIAWKKGWFHRALNGTKAFVAPPKDVTPRVNRLENVQ